MESTKQVYVISLDEVDLNLLPINYKQSCDKETPLWTKSNMDLRRNDYYKFEIKKTANSIETINAAITYVTCHLCDIEVPKIFFKEHMNSFRHKFNTKIAEVALERLQKQIQVKNELDDDDINTTSYFCPQCSIIIDSDKSDHDKSIAHKNSILLENFLKDFLYFYTNETVANEGNLQAAIKHKVDELTKLDTHINLEVDEIKDKRKYIDTLNKNSVKQEIESKVKQESIKENKTLTKNNERKYKLTTKEYIDILNEKHNTKPMVFKAIDDNVEIVTIDGCVVIVNSEQFHGLEKIGKKLLQCMLCKYIIKVNEFEDHLLSDAHMKLVSLPLQDKHCERRISDSWKHCLICNIIITENYGYHSSRNLKHDQNLSNALMFDNFNDNINKTTDSNGNNIRIDIKEVNNFNEEVVEMKKINDIESDQHFCKPCNIMICKNQIIKHENTAKHIKNSKWIGHYLIEYKDNDKVSCRVCETDIEYNVASLKNHFSNFDHIGNYDKLLNLNSIRDVDGINFYCGVCDTYFLFKHELLHIDSEDHKLNNNAENIETEVEVEIYTDSDSKKEISPIETIYNDNIYTCKVCNVTVPNNDYNITEHNNGRVHQQNLIAKKHLMRRDNAVDTHRPVQARKLHYQMIETTTPGVITCTICQVNLTNNEANIATHIDGAVHCTKYNTFLESNFLSIEDNNVFCSVCSVRTGIRCEFSHCIGRNHNNNLLINKIATKTS